MIQRVAKVTLWLSLVSVGWAWLGDAALATQPKKARIFVVSSYHREYLWSQETNKGLCAALVELKYLTQKQADEYTRKDYVEGDKAVVKKTWMDTKRKSSQADIAKTTARILPEISAFKPDIILLGDDNAANYIGSQYIDTPTPVVFWGINGTPLKYNLLNSVEKPGHNVTGIYQSGYMKEAIFYLQKLVPDAKTIAILADDSETGRARAKELRNLAADGKLAMQIVETVVTNSLSEWKTKALALKDKVDAFYIANHNTIKDDQGRAVDQLEIGAWYLRNIKKPDCADEKQFTTEGILLVVDDSGFKQGYEAIKTAHEILAGKKPGDIPARAPERGAIIANRERAKMLGIGLKGRTFIEEFVDKALALEKFPGAKK